ncbi:Sfb3p [Sugiyamaella lignohabitans]|uniref:Sfb3p n=1 Tax=Sugiyamaella lignohabitans TaxID=796027 RepID=A0A161HHG2_9ASCO|nr:Sfb3p [Sugiyamaella lignohabitans]ANB15460.1 Sfb3p [Sugiyamaella lignohabitans]
MDRYSTHTPTGMVDAAIHGVEHLSLGQDQNQPQNSHRQNETTSPQPLVTHHKKKHAHAYHNLYASGTVNPADMTGGPAGIPQSDHGGQTYPGSDVLGHSIANAGDNRIASSDFSLFPGQNYSDQASLRPDVYAVRTGQDTNSSDAYSRAQTEPQVQYQSQHNGGESNSVLNEGKSIRSFKNVNVVPSVVEDREFAQQLLGPEPLFKTFQHHSPPPAAIDYDVLDQGVSGPNFARLTMYNVPATDQLRANTKLPLGMVVRPFASSSAPVPVSDFTSFEPPRCRRCRTYINPSMIFTEGGTKFVCNMCQFANYVSADYFQPIDASNRRIDWQDRPELALGTYDIAVAEEYWPQEGVKPSTLKHLFLIDVSQESVKKDIPKLTAEAIRRLLYGRYNESEESSTSNDDTELNNFLVPQSLPKGTQIAIATIDKAVHFYNLNPVLEQPQMIVMNDVSDPFVPLEIGLFVDPVESQIVIEQLLDQIDLLFEQNHNSEVAFGAGLEVGLRALEATGGKVTASLCCLPTVGPGHLYYRETSRKNLESEKDLYKASSQYYINLGKKYAKAGIGLELFMVPNTYIDVANVGEVARRSGGHLHYFPHFVPERDGRRFIAEMIRASSSEIGYQAQLKVRCSNGLQVAAYYGNFHQESDDIQTDPVFGIVDSRSTIGVLFSYDGKLDTKLDAHFQAALLYTSADGQRRVRVTNIVTGVTEQFKPLMNYVDIDSCMGIMSREINTRIVDSLKPLKDIRLQLQDRIIEVFAQYRRFAGTGLAPTLLLMPVSLRGFIINCLALQKSRILRDSTHISTDSRMSTISLVNSMDADELSLFLYPRIIGLHNLRPEDCSYNQQAFIMPINVRASVSYLDEGGAYLLYNGQSLIMWLHQLVSPLLIQDLFGAQDLNSINPYMNELPVLSTDISRQTRALVDYFAKRSKLTFLGIQIARQGLDGAELEFMAQLVEDRIFDCQKYSDYVTFVHRQSRAAFGE